jgi:hypothetical protein
MLVPNRREVEKPLDLDALLDEQAGLGEIIAGAAGGQIELEEMHA